MVVMNDWVVLQTNGAPADTPLSVVAIHQADAARQFAMQPFAECPASDDDYPTSISPSAVSVDAIHHRIYALDAGIGQIGALELREDGLHSIWTEPQRTTEFLALIGPPDQRVLVGTEIPLGQPLRDNTERECTISREPARSSS